MSAADATAKAIRPADAPLRRLALVLAVAYVLVLQALLGGMASGAHAAGIAASMPVFDLNADFAPLTHVIFGGENVRASDPIARRVPRLELIILDNGEKYRRYCSTSLVHPRLALTAAHCLPQGEERASLRLVFTLPNKKTVDLNVIDWMAHPVDDLAILELASDAPDSAEIFILPEPQRSYKSEYIEVAGYGQTTSKKNKETKERILRTVALKVNSYDLYSERIVVEQSDDKGLCNGDSGGPGWIKDGDLTILIGISVQTKGRVEEIDPCNREAYLINTSYYLDWIFNTAREIQVKTTRPYRQI